MIRELRMLFWSLVAQTGNIWHNMASNQTRMPPWKPMRLVFTK